VTLEIILQTGHAALTDAEERRLERRFQALDRRLAHFPNPVARLKLTDHREQRRVQADLRVQLGPLGGHLISHQSGDTVDHAVRLAIEDVERQLERRLAMQRGEPSYGVPSRRPERRRTTLEGGKGRGGATA
jgi:ribosome-associated translation inhibitor RaiA